MDEATLRERLDRFQRLTLANYPTALEPLEHLTAHLQGPAIWCKRDDAIGPAMGGNKARKLEYLMADAQHTGAHKVVTFGGLQSNHARMTAAVARQLGMEPHLFFFEPRPQVLMGNQLLDGLVDAKMHHVPIGGGGGMTIETTNRLVRALSWLMVGSSYFIPVGGHSALGCLGYVACALEIHEQSRELGLRNVTVVTAVGTGGTLAGLMAGFSLVHSEIKITGIDVGRLWRRFAPSIAHLTGDIYELLGEHKRNAPRSVPLIEDRYVGLAYGKPSPAGDAALCQVAADEGIFLDPVYTGKAMAGLLDLARTGYFGPASNVIFLHTGGAPAIFAFPELAVKELRRTGSVQN